jgi:hypothetical protein
MAIIGFWLFVFVGQTQVKQLARYKHRILTNHTNFHCLSAHHDATLINESAPISRRFNVAFEKTENSNEIELNEGDISYKSFHQHLLIGLYYYNCIYHDTLVKAFLDTSRKDFYLPIPLYDWLHNWKYHCV